MHAGQDFVVVHAIAGLGASGAEAAVVALTHAMVGDLDEAAEMDFVAHIFATNIIGLGEEPLQLCRVGLFEPVEDFLMSQARHWF